MEIRVAQGPEDLAAALAVRRVVFIEEQSVPEDEEVDGLDPQCLHLVALLDGRVVGTARLLEKAGRAKAQRVAVLKELRGTGVGRRLMERLHAEAAARGHREITLGAQLSALGFYEGLGYTAEGAVFMDAGIPHRTMRRALP